MRLLVTLALLAAVSGAALASDPHMSYGPPGEPWSSQAREDVCQYGFQDDYVGSGFTLGLGQQLGIHCTGPMTIIRVGFYVEFLPTPGTVDIVILDGGTEVQRTPCSPAVGNNEFDIPDIAVADPCIMLCPQGNFWGVTGEDATNGPFNQNCFWSNSCACSNLLYENLTIWAVYGGSVPNETTSWGQVRSLYR